MTPTPTEVSQEEIDVVGQQLTELGFTVVEGEADGMEMTREEIASLIAALDQYRQEHSIVPGYLEQCDTFQIADHIEWGDALYRFKTEGVAK